MQEPNPQSYRIDVTQMFNTVSIQAINMTTQHLGGFDRLSDMCCHLAIMLRNGISRSDINIEVQDIIRKLNVNVLYQDSIQTVIMTYINVLNNNFLSGLSMSQQNHPINHIKILDAKHDHTCVYITRQYVSCEFVALVYGY